MGRKATSKQDVLQGSGSRLNLNGHSHEQVRSLVCNLFSGGLPPARIRDRMEEQYEIVLRREDPWRLILEAAVNHQIRYVAPLAEQLSGQIKDRYKWLETVRVVDTAAPDDVSDHTATLLIDLIRAYHRAHPEKEEVHLGLAGGSNLRKMVMYFAERLRRPEEGLPKTLVVHALVAGFYVKDPTRDPNAYFTYFALEPQMLIETRFVALYAPGMVRSHEMGEMQKFKGIREAFQKAGEIDIIVTSCSEWECRHSGLYNMYSQDAAETLRELQASRCIGDMMWRPLSQDGPIEIEVEIRVMTLMELSHLPELVAKGKHVVLLTAPCRTCGRPKSGILRAILNMRPHVVTHLVADSRTASGLFVTDGR